MGRTPGTIVDTNAQAAPTTPTSTPQQPATQQRSQPKQVAEVAPPSPDELSSRMNEINTMHSAGLANGMNAQEGQSIYLAYKNGQMSWDDAVNAYSRYANPEDRMKRESVKMLVDSAFLQDINKDLKDLQQNPFWQAAPDDSVRREAWAEIQRIMGDPQTLADYVKSKGIANLNQYAWWNESPHKTQAWSIVSQAQQPDNTQAPGWVGGSPSETDTTGATDQSTNYEENKQALDEQARIDREEYLAELDQALADGLITPDEKLIFEASYDSWNLIGEDKVNIDSVIQQLDKIKEETIDPYFKQRTDFYTTNLMKAVGYQEQARERELEAQRTNAGEAIKQAKAGQEKAGMTFTGQSIEKLGAESAFAQPGAEGVATPMQTPFGGGFYEGTVNQASRLMASSSAQRYQEALQQMGQAAEMQLGASGAAGLVPGYATSGVQLGAIQEAKQQRTDAQLKGLLGAQRTQQQIQQPIINY